MNVHDAIREALAGVAPEADLQSMDETTSLREAFDLDSMDFLNFIIGLNRLLNIDIPEADYPKVQTVHGAVTYLEARQSR